MDPEFATPTTPKKPPKTPESKRVRASPMVAFSSSFLFELNQIFPEIASSSFAALSSFNSVEVARPGSLRRPIYANARKKRAQLLGRGNTSTHQAVERQCARPGSQQRKHTLPVLVTQRSWQRQHRTTAIHADARNDFKVAPAYEF
jgi:hypothetical protein